MALQNGVQINELENTRIDQLPRGIPVGADLVPYRSVGDGITKATEASNILPQTRSQIFEWISNKVPAYTLDEVVTRGGKWYQSKTINNISIPGQDVTKWLPLEPGNSGGWWKAGVYSEDRPIVFSDHSGDTQMYELVNLVRPFISLDIVVEEAAGYWSSILNKNQLFLVPTDVTDIVLDHKGRSNTWFQALNSIDSNRFISFLTDQKLLEFKFRFTLANLVHLQFPDNVKMSDALFYEDKTYRNMDIGEFEMVGSYNQDSYFIKIFGPAQGGANYMPTVFDNVVSRAANILDGPRTYYDPEGDLENNPPPTASNIVVTGIAKPGNTLTLGYDFFSPSGYIEDPPEIQWYRADIDGSNSEALTGETTDEYDVVDEDIDLLIYPTLIVKQTAPVPANGNPNSILYIAVGKVIEENIVVVPELDLALHFNHYLKAGTYDNALKRAADLGLSGGANFFTSPVGNEPTWNAGDGTLSFDPTTVQQYLDFANISAAGSRVHDMVGVFQGTSFTAVRILFAIVSNFDFRVLANSFVEFKFSGNADFTGFVPVANTKYAFRVRTSSNGTLASVRLQINRDPNTGVFAFDQEIQLANNGLSLVAGTGRVGSSKAATPAQGWTGKIAELAFKIGGHIDPLDEEKLWKRLTNVRDAIA